MKTKFIRFLSLLLVVLTALTVLSLVSCDKKDNNNTSIENTTDAESQEAKTTLVYKTTKTNPQTKIFVVDVVDDKGTTTTFVYETTETILGSALLKAGLIEGTVGQYGLYVQKVNGVEAIYENDGAYWAFYKSGEYMMTGVDSTNVEDGDHFELKYTK